MRLRSTPPIFAFASLGKHRIHANVQQNRSRDFAERVAGSPLSVSSRERLRRTAGMRNPPRPPAAAVSDCRIPATRWAK